jgi:hypothetical protein
VNLKTAFQPQMNADKKQSKSAWTLSRLLAENGGLFGDGEASLNYLCSSVSIRGGFNRMLCLLGFIRRMDVYRQ